MANNLTQKVNARIPHKKNHIKYTYVYTHYTTFLKTKYLAIFSIILSFALAQCKCKLQHSPKCFQSMNILFTTWLMKFALSWDAEFRLERENWSRKLVVRNFRTYEIQTDCVMHDWNHSVHHSQYFLPF